MLVSSESVSCFDFFSVVVSWVSSEPVTVVVSSPINSVTDSPVAIAVKPDPVAPESDSVETSSFPVSATHYQLALLQVQLGL